GDLACEARVVARGAARALDEDHELLARAVLGEHPHRRAAADARAGHAIDRLLDVLGRVVAAAQHDRVLRAAEEEELALEDEAAVARVEPAVAERLRRGLGQPVVALHQRGPAHEDAAEPTLAELPALAVADREREPRERRAERDERLAALAGARLAVAQQR